MSFPHHHGFDEQSRLVKKLQEQQEGTAKREWPKGRVSGDDDGEIAFAIGSDPETELIRIDFGKPVEWLAMPPMEAVEFAQTLIKHARAVSKEPVRIVIN